MISAIAVIGIAMSYSSIPVITYEINTECELFEKKAEVFGGSTFQTYDQKLRQYAASGGDLGFGPDSYLSKIRERYAKDLMNNYKINPDLYKVVYDHASGREYVKCEK